MLGELESTPPGEVPGRVSGVVPILALHWASSLSLSAALSLGPGGVSCLINTGLTSDFDSASAGSTVESAGMPYELFFLYFFPCFRWFCARISLDIIRTVSTRLRQGRSGCRCLGIRSVSRGVDAEIREDAACSGRASSPGTWI